MGRPARGHSVKKRALGEERALAAVELCLRDGKTYDEAAKILGYASKSGVAMAIATYRDRLTKQTLEIVEEDRARLIGYARRIVDRFLPLVDSPDLAIATSAAETAIKAIREWSKLRGIEEVPAPVVQIHVAAKSSYDISRLTPEDLLLQRALRLKMLGEGATVETEGHEVAEPQPKEEQASVDPPT